MLMLDILYIYTFKSRHVKLWKKPIKETHQGQANRAEQGDQGVSPKPSVYRSGIMSYDCLLCF